MSVKDKYYKYKLKYLNAKKQLGSGKFSTIQYEIDNDGNIKNKETLRALMESEENAGKHHEHELIMGVYEKRKICSCFTIKELLSNIEQYKLPLNEILKTCLIINDTEVKNDISEDIFNSADKEDPSISVLYFADIVSAQIYMDIYNNNPEIFPRNILRYLFESLKGRYSPEIYVNESYLFHIFHGIIFSYDIKDIYGYIKEYRDGLSLYVQIEKDRGKQKQLLEQYNNLDTINKTYFFIDLKKIINIILKASEREPEKGPTKSVLTLYSFQILQWNITRDKFTPIRIKNAQVK